MIISLFFLVITGASIALTVATAANMQYAMEEIAASYKSVHGKEIKTVYGASGKLAAQIIAGAPFDVFISADMGYPESLLKKGLTYGTIETYAFGSLVLWTMKEIELKPDLFFLKSKSVNKIAIGDPNVTVYGPAALQVLAKLGLEDAVAGKLVYGDNVSQVAQYTVTGAADVGFNPKSVVLSGAMTGKGKWIEIDKELYSPIAQGAVVLQYGKKNNESESETFMQFLLGSNARTILGKYGYILPAKKREINP